MTLRLNWIAIAGILLVALTAGCGPDAAPTAAPPPPPPPPPPPVVTGLKDIVLSNLPSPYYHFEYDTTGRLTFASFASDFTRYDLLYAGSRISEMDNNILVNHDRLIYVYDDSGRVTSVHEVDQNGVEFRFLLFSYEGQKLVGVERHRDLAGTFVIDKTMTLSYYPDGNLRELSQHRPEIANQQPDQRYGDLFEQYDTGINVDGFSLLHDDFFDHLVLLPVELQKGNPRRVTRTGDGPTYVAEYSYAYDASNRPLTRSGVVTLTDSANAGQVFHTSSVFSYY